MNWILLCFSVFMFRDILCQQMLPLVINTWGFTNATIEAWDAIYNKKLSSVDSVVSHVLKDEIDETVQFKRSLQNIVFYYR